MEAIFSFSCSTKAAGQGQGEDLREESVPLLLIEKVSTTSALLLGSRTRARHARGTTGRTKESTMPRTREVDAIEQAFSHAWIVDDMIPDEEREERMLSFQQWVRSFETHPFKHAFHHRHQPHPQLPPLA